MSKTTLMAVRVPKYLEKAVREFSEKFSVSMPAFLRYAIDMSLANLIKWSSGDAEKIQQLLLERETQLAINQATADATIARINAAKKVYAEMVADADATVKLDEENGGQ